MKKFIKIVFIILLIGIMLISSFLLYKNFKEDNKQEEIFEELTNIAEDKNNDDNVESENEIDMQKLYELNQDIVGWIRIDDTSIDYPVMQTKDRPNYYLRRNFYKEYSYWGTPYLSENCDIETSDNLIIYGHHINNSKIFGELKKYEKQEFYNNHKNITFYTMAGKEEYEIIAVFKTVAHKGFEYYNFINGNNESEYNDFLEKCKNLSLYNIDNTASYGDRLITLSTCEYSQKNGRLVIVAKQNNEEIKDADIQEQGENEIIEASTNEVIEDSNIDTPEEKEVKEEKKETQKNAEETIVPNNDIPIQETAVTSIYNEDSFNNGYLLNYPSFAEQYATLKISKINVNAPIYFGATDEILLKGVAHDSGSYFCGENGTIIMCGHNYMNNFKRFGELTSGDIIEVKTNYGDFYYKLFNSEVVHETETYKLEIQRNKEILMIYTCYPFNSVGYTEYRYVIYAERI